MRRIAGCGALLAAGGCPAPEVEEVCPPAEVVFGLDAEPFAPLVDGDPVAIERGPQGGWHFPLDAEISGFGPLVSVTLWADDRESGARVAESWLILNPTPTDACAARLGRMLAILDVSALADGDADTPPEVLLPGRLLELGVAVEDGTVAAEARVEVAVAEGG